MRTALTALAVALAATGCGSEINRAADNKIVCSLAGEAFFVKPHIGDTSFIRRQPDADLVCAALAAKGE